MQQHSTILCAGATGNLLTNQGQWCSSDFKRAKGTTKATKQIFLQGYLNPHEATTKGAQGVKRSRRAGVCEPEPPQRGAGEVCSIQGSSKHAPGGVSCESLSAGHCPKGGGQAAPADRGGAAARRTPPPPLPAPHLSAGCLAASCRREGSAVTVATRARGLPPPCGARDRRHQRAVGRGAQARLWQPYGAVGRRTTPPPEVAPPQGRPRAPGPPGSGAWGRPRRCLRPAPERRTTGGAGARGPLPLPRRPALLLWALGKISRARPAIPSRAVTCLPAPLG